MAKRKVKTALAVFSEELADFLKEFHKVLKKNPQLKEKFEHISFLTEDPSDVCDDVYHTLLEAFDALDEEMPTR